MDRRARTHTHEHTHIRTFHPLTHAASGQTSTGIWPMPFCVPVSFFVPSMPLSPLCLTPLSSPVLQLLGPLLLPCLSHYIPPFPLRPSHPPSITSLLSLCPALLSTFCPWDFLLQALGQQEAECPPESSPDLEARREHKQREVTLSPEPNTLA